MKLFLMRHGQAFSAFEDQNRGLTLQGCADVERVVQQSPLRKGAISHIMHSGVARTEETAHIVANQLSIENLSACPQWLAENATIDLCVSMMSAWEDNTLLVSHQPFLTELCHYLRGDDLGDAQPVHFSPATLVCFDKVSDSIWQFQWAVSP